MKFIIHVFFIIWCFYLYFILLYVFIFFLHSFLFYFSDFFFIQFFRILCFLYAIFLIFCFYLFFFDFPQSFFFFLFLRINQVGGPTARTDFASNEGIFLREAVLFRMKPSLFSWPITAIEASVTSLTQRSTAWVWLGNSSAWQNCFSLDILLNILRWHVSSKWWFTY